MKIFPKEIIEHTTQFFVAKNTVKSKVIYGTVLLLMLVFFAALPFVQIELYSSGRGYLRPIKDRIPLNCLNSGKVLKTNFQNNLFIAKGDTLMVLENKDVQEGIALAKKQNSILTNEIDDLHFLVNSSNRNFRRLKTAKYKKELIEYNSGLQELIAKLKQLEIDFSRNEKLFDKDVIARAEFEKIQLEYELGKSSLNQYVQRRLNTWQANLTELLRRKQELDSDSVKLAATSERFVLTAPISGTLINVIGIEKGSHVNAGTVLAEITPDTELIAEFMITPRDIGLIDESKPVNFQIDAFNYNQWGMASGRIISIANDVEFVENQPFYRVKCKLNQNHLSLKNGYKGTFSKGMTLNARFEIAERTLYQLLYDKVDDWINPGNSKEIAQN